jgi:hypothetical protein
MPPAVYQPRPQHLCSLALMTLAAVAAFPPQSSPSSSPAPLATDALVRPQAPALTGDAAAYQPALSQRLREYEPRERPYVPRHVRRRIYPVDVERAVQRPPAPAPAPSEAPATAAAQTAPAAPQEAASGSAQQYALSLVGSAQFSCLDPLWERESGWNVYADNPGSGAYGIPQALPGDKMASAGADWQTDADTQVRWGISYIDSTYGSPCGAWQHEEADGWY